MRRTTPSETAEIKESLERINTSLGHLSELIIGQKTLLVDYHFSQEELKTLAFAVGVEYESLSAEGKSGKARELIAHLSRRGQLEMLLDWCMEMQPNVAWRR